MSKDKPDFHDAELVLKLYDLRREAVMRQAREAINRDFWPQTYDDFIAVTRMDNPLNGAYRQTSTYWEMAFGMGKYGILHADYLAENSGEGFLLFARVAPFLNKFRAEVSPTAFQNAEWMVQHSEVARTRVAMFQERFKKMANGK